VAQLAFGVESGEKTAQKKKKKKSAKKKEGREKKKKSNKIKKGCAPQLAFEFVSCRPPGT
jgi:hypothetical protein